MMEQRNDGVSLDELAILLGHKEIQLHLLNKQLKAALDEINRLIAEKTAQ
jgi:hypothetical protein